MSTGLMSIHSESASGKNCRLCDMALDARGYFFDSAIGRMPGTGFICKPCMDEIEHQTVEASKRLKRLAGLNRRKGSRGLR